LQEVGGAQGHVSGQLVTQMAAEEATCHFLSTATMATAKLAFANHFIYTLLNGSPFSLISIYIYIGLRFSALNLLSLPPPFLPFSARYHLFFLVFLTVAFARDFLFCLDHVPVTFPIAVSGCVLLGWLKNGFFIGCGGCLNSFGEASGIRVNKNK